MSLKTAHNLVILAKMLAESDRNQGSLELLEADWKKNLLKVALPALLNMMTPSNAPAQTEKTGIQYIAKDQVPAWVKNPNDGLKKGQIGGVGSSGVADVDTDMAKDQAELDAKVKLSAQLKLLIIGAIKKNGGNTEDYKDKVKEQVGNKISSSVVQYAYFDKSGNQNRMNPKYVFTQVALDVQSSIPNVGQELKTIGMPDDLKEKVLKTMAEEVK